jgi:multiple sugar transport system permease protein
MALLGFSSAALLALGYSLPLEMGRPVPAGMHLPLVWPVIPFAAWVGAAMAVAACIRIGQSLLSIHAEQRSFYLKSAAIWTAMASFAFVFARQSNEHWGLLKGMVTLRPADLAALVLAALGAFFGMAWAITSSTGRRRFKAFTTHIALVSGSVLFGLPFVWVVLTSFKEPRDMSAESGLVWVPMVTVTVPYMDPKDPLIEATFQGQTVQGNIIDRLPDGSATIDILRPSVLRGMTFIAKPPLKRVSKDANVVTGTYQGTAVEAMVLEERDDLTRLLQVLHPPALAGTRFVAKESETELKRVVGLRGQNYGEALEYLPVETAKGLVYLKNTLILVIMNVLGTLLSSSLVAYAFARLRFPLKNQLFVVLLSTMMLPAAVTLLPTFLIFRNLGWIDTLLPLWAPAFLGSAFNIFMLRQFFATIPLELEDAAKIDGCSYWKTYWTIMLPQIKPALAVVAIWTFMGAWNNFMGPLVYITSPENMPIAYALQLFQSERSAEYGLLMAATTMSILPVVLLFFVAQKYFIEGVTLSGLGGR